MSYAIVWSSKGGNTQRVAEAVAAALAATPDNPAYVGPVPAEGSADEASALAADTVLAGFWTDKGTCAPEMAAFLGRLGGKRVFLFGTAGFGGADAYFAQILERVRAHLPQDAVYAGGAMCQGKMGPGVRARYEAMLAENPEDRRAQAMIENFDAARSHPDDADIARIVQAVHDAIDA